MRIWFNRGFSLAPIAEAMMTANPDLSVFISIGEGMPNRQGASISWIEPNLPDEDYLGWAESQIKVHQIDIFIPTRKRQLIAGAALPCRVELPTTPDVLALLEDKAAFADAISAQDFHLPTWSAASVAELRQALEDFRRSYGPDAVPCVKPRQGVNGHGFWKLAAPSPTSHLLDPDSRNIDLEMFFAAIEAEERYFGAVSPLVLMEFLPGPEVSFDILAHQGRILRYIARTKYDDRQHLQSEHHLEPAAADLVQRFGLSGVINVQFRLAENGGWKALEINTRPAGGSVYAEQFGGRLLADWGGLLTGRIGPDDVDQTPLDIGIAFKSSLERIG